MNAIGVFLSQPLTECVGWALVHFLWQGALLAALLGAFLWFTRRRSANLRYVACCGALLLMAACPAVTFFVLAGPGAAPAVELPAEVSLLAMPAEMSARAPAEIGLAGLTVAEPAKPARPTQLPLLLWWQSARDFVEANLSWFVTAWLIGVLLLSARLLFGWGRVRRMKRSGRADACAGCRSMIQALAKRLRVSQPVRILESAVAQTPVVIGWLRPVILLPASVLTGLTAEQLEAVLAHELAHVRRYDYLVNLLQTAVETLLFYHPAVHWVSHRIRAEREVCCDERAVEVCGDSLTYARALTELEGLRGKTTSVAVAASGGSLLERIRRIVGVAEPRESIDSRWLAGLFAIGGVTLLALGPYMDVRASDTEGLPSEHHVELAAGAEAGGESSAPEGQPQLKQFHLSGRVLLPDGSPAAGATVLLRCHGRYVKERAERESTDHTVTTTARGRYDFGLLAVPTDDQGRPGSGRLLATLDGYGLDGARVHFRRLDGGPGRSLAVLSGEVSHDLALAREGTRGGTILGPDGGPLEGVEVRVDAIRFDLPDGGRDYIWVPAGCIGARTDVLGRFKLAGIPAEGSARCSFAKDGYVGAQMSLSRDEEPEITVPLAGAVEGKVVFGATGEPAPNVQVYARTWRTFLRGNAQYTESASAVTDHRGEFRMAGLLHSSATVGVETALPGMEHTAEKALNVPIVAGETTSGIVLRLVKGGMLKGAVADAATGQPVAGASVSASRLVSGRWEGYGQAKTDAQGRYSIRLPGGEYGLRCTAPEGYLRDWRMRPDEMPTVTVQEGGEAEAPVIKLEPAASITIRVTTPGGDPAPGVHVVLVVGEALSFRSAPTDASGTLKVDGQRAGVTVQFTAQNEDGTLRGEGEITPKLGQDNDLVITLAEARPCSVVGRVADESGEPIGGATIFLNQPAGAGSWRGEPRATTDADGRFEKALSPGDDMYVSVSSQGYGRRSSDHFSLDEGQTHDVGVMTLARADKELTGRVLDRNGEPVAGLRLTAYGPQSTHQEALTGKNGTFHLRELVDETIWLVLMSEDGRILAQESVQAGTGDFVFRVYELGEEPEPEVVAEPGKPAPELVLEEGAAVRLAGLKGRPVILAFVSIYSRPCARLLLELKAAQEKHGDEALAVVAVHDRTASPEEIEEFRKENGIAFPIVRVPKAEGDGWHSETFLSYGVKALPRLALVDASGRLKTFCDGSRISDIVQEAVVQALRR